MSGASDAVDAIVGRDAEVAALRGFVAESTLRALCLIGSPGAGKTTLWEAGTALAREEGLRVLTAQPSGAEAELSFAALIDLCEGVDDAALADLPAPQRSALEVALLRAEPTGRPPEPHAIALGFLNALRVLTTRGSVVVAVDDVQWLDAPSADALTFAARRLEHEPVCFLLARRPGGRPALEVALERRRLERMDVGPLSFGATRRLLSERLGLSLSRHVLRRLVDATLGNPLFALEVGRTLVEQGEPRIGADIPVPDAVEDVLGTRVGRLPRAERRLLLAIALSANLRLADLEAIGDPAAVEDALDSELLVVEGERVRASHPLLAAAAKRRSRPKERRELHLALAGAVDDEELRALHLALATDVPDEALAAAVAAAADDAATRGAREEAVQLAEHALRLTPADAPARSERLLALARDLQRAGDVQRVTDVLTPELESLPTGVVRARAWLLLSEGGGVRNLADLEWHLDRALEECPNDPGIRGYVLAMKAGHTAATAVVRIREAEALAVEALSYARRAGPDLERLALCELAWTRSMAGKPIHAQVERFNAASDAATYFADSPERVACQQLVWRGEMAAARETLTRLLALADEQGEPTSFAWARGHMCELDLRAGGWAHAERLLDEWVQSADRELVVPPMYERCRALLAAGRGIPGDAMRWAKKAIAGARETRSRWDELEALRGQGMAALVAHDPAEAAESLRTVWEHTRREGVDEPGAFPVAPDLVEALAALGEADEAAAVTDRLRELAERQEHPWGLATAKRCAAVTRLAAGSYDEAAAASLADAADDYGRLGLPFDRARTLLSLGRAQRRVRKWGAAREALEAAVSAFDELGSGGWADAARSELSRVGARKPSPTGELTPAERKTVELAAAGLANKEIAQALHVTVGTVEVHLSRSYAKLGIRSRAQLAARLATAKDSGFP